jgi:hypothetical protein
MYCDDSSIKSVDAKQVVVSVFVLVLCLFLYVVTTC